MTSTPGTDTILMHLLGDFRSRSRGAFLCIYDSAVLLGLEEAPYPMIRFVRNAAGRPTSEGVTFGRSSSSDVVVRVASVSKHHATFVEAEGTWFVADMGSKNGTRVNGERLASRRPVAIVDGDVISFGDHVMRFYTPAGFYDAVGEMVVAASAAAVEKAN